MLENTGNRVIKFNAIEFFFFFCIFFVLLFIEGYRVGPIQVTLIWKFPLIIVLFLFVLLYPQLKKSSLFFVGTLFALKYVIYPYSSFNIVLDIIELIKFSIIPLFSDSFAYFFSKKKWILDRFPLYLAIGIILSSIPFLLGILESFEDIEELKGELAKYGGSGQTAFVGGFGGPHNAAISMTAAVLFLISFLQGMKAKISGLKVFIISVLILGLVVIYKTYVRTGYICLILGGGYLLLWRKKISYYIKMTPILILFMGGIAFKILTDPILLMRLTDQSVHNKKGPSTDQLGSGRGLIWRMAIKNWSESPPINVMLGNGMKKSMDLMATTPVGAPLVSHNGYLDVLQHSGLVGISLFLFYLSVIFRYAQRARDALIKKRLTAFFILLVVSFFFQGGHFFWMDCLIAFTLAKCILEKREISEKKLEENRLALDN